MLRSKFSSLIALATMFVASVAFAQEVNIGLPASPFSEQYESSVVDAWRAESSKSVGIREVPIGAAQAMAHDLDVLMLSGQEESALCAAGELANAGADINLDLSHLTSPTNCGVPFVTYGRTIGYRTDLVDGQMSPADFFDVDNRPGGRALQESPKGLLEMALLADGVDHSVIYDVLATDDGIRRAFGKLNQLVPHALWTQNSAKAVESLNSGNATFAILWAGTLNSAMQSGAALGATRDFMLVQHDYLAMPTQAADNDAAASFLEYATSPKGFETFIKGTDGRYSVPVDELNGQPPDNDQFVQACSAGTCPCVGLSGGCRKACCREMEGVFGHFELDEDFWDQNGERLNRAFEDWRRQ
ncbi:extracellular solute-binding protein [uncultured Tateyamaria sp.]|uniref:extracellular solute-binding protein n=1 Tax=Tateyamaria sp. 1078 TaxID=3417464 RepID=UPI00262665A9|nr:extracellular solute-binding protein [uncultured Tateyamaria sp.]